MLISVFSCLIALSFLGYHLFQLFSFVTPIFNFSFIPLYQFLLIFSSIFAYFLFNKKIICMKPNIPNNGYKICTKFEKPIFETNTPTTHIIIKFI